MPKVEENNLKMNNTKMNFGARTLLQIILGGICAVLVVLIAIVVITSIDLSKDSSSGSGSTSLSNQISPLMLEYLDAKTTKETCFNGLTSDPLKICEDKCHQEFCTGKYSPENDGICVGSSCLGTSLDITQCILGCNCCKAKNECLIKNGGSLEECKVHLPECNFDSVQMSEYKNNNICFLAQSSNYCSFDGLFPHPITC